MTLQNLTKKRKIVAIHFPPFKLSHFGPLEMNLNGISQLFLLELTLSHNTLFTTD